MLFYNVTYDCDVESSECNSEHRPETARRYPEGLGGWGAPSCEVVQNLLDSGFGGLLVLLPFLESGNEARRAKLYLPFVFD